MEQIAPVHTSLEDVGYKLLINPPAPRPGVYALDIETNEAEPPVFVGLALVPWGKKEVYYFTDLSAIRDTLERSKLIGHNVKDDVKWLRGWGLNISSQQILHDSMILAYSLNPTREKYGLKALAKEEIGWSWPTYREMVGKGKAKQTLEKQAVERVAGYCGLDAASSMELTRRFILCSPASELRLSKSGGLRQYSTVEMPTYRILLDMETKGALLDVEYVQQLDEAYRIQISQLQARFAKESGCDGINPNSPAQVLSVLFKHLGIHETSTDVKVLRRYAKKFPVIQTLLDYRKLSKLQGTYTGALLDLATLPRVHCRFNQVAYNSANENSGGIRTTRLSSSNPNLQNIPSRGEHGPTIRACFISAAGNTLLSADYSQVEYRLLAHYSREPVLINAFTSGKDVHSETVRVLLGLGPAEEISETQRALGKTINFASIYGAGPRKISEQTGLPEEECKEFLKAYFDRLPNVTAWIARTKAQAHIDGGIRKLHGQFIPLPGLKSASMYERFHWERVAVNSVIQGTAADIFKLAMIRLSKLGIVANIPVHDELVFELPDLRQLTTIKAVMENVVKLRVPLVVDVGHGANWREAKE